MRRPDGASYFGRDAGYRFLRSKGNSIEGGTSEILRNIIAERVLGLPAGAPGGQGRAMEGPAAMSQATQTHAQPPGSRIGRAAATGAGPAVHRGRDRAARGRARPAGRTRPGGATCWPGPRPSRPTTPGCGRRWPQQVGCAGLLVPEDGRRRRRLLPGGRGGGRGARPGRRRGAVPGQRGGRHGRPAVGRRRGAAGRAGQRRADRRAGRPVRHGPGVAAARPRCGSTGRRPATRPAPTG